MITLMSHGFKFGTPSANIIFDVSYFKNPWRDEAIRNEEDVEKRRELIINFMNEQKEFSEFIESVFGLVRYYHNHFPSENLVIAFCCSAGEYRSPSVLEAISKKMNEYGIVHKKLIGMNSKLQ